MSRRASPSTQHPAPSTPPGGFLRDARDSLWLELERCKHAGLEPPEELRQAYELVARLMQARGGTP
jgi:hypothetical protein